MSVLLLPLLPLVAAAGVWLVRGRPRVSAAVAVGALAGSVALGVWAAATEPGTTVAWSPAFELALRVEGIGRLMVVLVPFVGAPILADVLPRLRRRPFLLQVADGSGHDEHHDQTSPHGGNVPAAVVRLMDGR